MMIMPVEGDRRRYLPLLLLADEQLSMIDRYIDRGDMFVISEDDRVIAECIVTDEGGGVAEIKNLAVDPAWQNRRYGRALVCFVSDLYRATHHTLMVSTGDSPLTVPFYERCGFVKRRVIKDYFVKHYDRPIYEAGQRVTDAVILTKRLTTGDGEGEEEGLERCV